MLGAASVCAAFDVPTLGAATSREGGGRRADTRRVWRRSGCGFGARPGREDARRRTQAREGGDSAAAPRSRIGGGRDTGLEIVQGGTTLGGGRKRGSGGSAIREKKLT